MVTGTEILESNLEMHGDRRFDEIKYVINDLSQINDFDISTDDITALQTVDRVAEYSNARLKIAIIVSNNEALIELATLYRKSMQDNAYEAEIFANLEEAHKWARTREIFGI
ncbi:MAG: hypothetical protein OEL79_02300 [Chromatiales bacterium]|nr:hypothetical protein [Chromatiales bacterium]